MAASGSVTLIMRQGPRLNQVFELTKDVYTIGREAGNDIMVEDSQISRHHARLTRQGNSYVVEDLGSTNGAFVNGRRVSTPILLSNGDMLGFADTIVFAVQVLNPMSDATVISRGTPGATATGPATAPAFAPPPPPPPPMRSAPQPPVYAPPPQPVYAPPPQPVYAPQQPVYAPPPQQPMAQPPAKSSSGRYVLIGLGCLVLLAIVGAIGLVAWSFIDCGSFKSIFGGLIGIAC